MSTNALEVFVSTSDDHHCVPADDAISIDTSGMSIKDAIAAAIAAVDSKHC